MKPIERKLIEEKIENLDIGIFDGPIETVIESIQNLQSLHTKFKKLNFLVYRDYSEVSIDLYGSRLETDDEYNIRLKKFLKTQADKQRREDKKLEKAKLEQLKADDKKRELEALMKKFNVTTLEELRNIINYLSNLKV